MNVLKRLDNFIIDRVAQPLVNWAEPWTSPRAIAASMIMGFAVLSICRFYLQSVAGTFGLQKAVLSAFLLAACAVNYVWAVYAPAVLISTLRVQPLQIVLRLLLIAAIVVIDIPVLVIEVSKDNVLTLLGSFLFGGSLYVLACSPPPPRRRKQTVGANVWAAR